ncbi:hypothetical protein [Erwinia psidii]|uniref:hypothetical protein n=1 Tax=Erwinia psidii TaxID=69224 RepID=UPI00226BB393|nr:hypothetical protein [Erwinia psidii]
MRDYFPCTSCHNHARWSYPIYQKANLLIQSGSKKSGLQALSSSSFVGESRVLLGQKLKNTGAGRLIIINDKSGRPKSLALSLGEGDFLTDNSKSLVASRAQNKNILDSEKMSLLFREESFSCTENSVDITRLRVGSLLGNDAFFNFTPHSGTLTVRAHGASGNVNVLNPFEFADVIRGLLINKGIEINQVKNIQLESCFGGLGLPSLSESLASLLNKKVVAYSGRFSINQRDNPSRWSLAPKTYEPPVTELNRNAILSQCKRHYRIMNSLGNIYNYLSRKRVVRSAGSSPDVPFNVLMSNVARFVLHQMTVEEFIKLQPEYDNTDRNAREFIRAGYLTSNVHDFIERCMDIFVLNENSFLLFNAAVSNNSE